MNRKSEIEIIHIPEKFIRMARRRTTPMIRHWAVRGTDSFAELVVAAYLQGAADGFDAAEKQKEKLMKNNTEEKSERAEHLEFCKQRALEYIKLDQPDQAFASFMSDMQKYPKLANHTALPLFMQMFYTNQFKSTEELGKFIEGFN